MQTLRTVVWYPFTPDQLSGPFSDIDIDRPNKLSIEYYGKHPLNHRPLQKVGRHAETCAANQNNSIVLQTCCMRITLLRCYFIETSSRRLNHQELFGDQVTFGARDLSCSRMLICKWISTRTSNTTHPCYQQHSRFRCHDACACHHSRLHRWHGSAGLLPQQRHGGG